MLWVRLETITKGETNLVHIGTKKMFDPYKMMACLSSQTFKYVNYDSCKILSEPEKDQKSCQK
jgi:hypothetical protein